MSIYDRWRERRSARKPVTKKDLREIVERLERIEMKIEELQAEIVAVTASNETLNAKLDKIQAEVQKLLDAGIPTGDLSQEFVDAWNALKTSHETSLSKAQVIDDQNPDEPVA